MVNKLNVVSNVALCLASVVVLAQMGPALYRTHFQKREASPQEFKIGMPVAVTGIENGRVNVIVGISPRCSFCQHDAEKGVYSRISAAAAKVSATVLFVMPEFNASDKEAKKFAADFQMSGKLVAYKNGEFPFGSTPTVLLVDAQGKLIKGWTSSLAAVDDGITDREKELVTLLAKKGVI
jgi:hypothetical protein